MAAEHTENDDKQQYPKLTYPTVQWTTQFIFNVLQVLKVLINELL
jgi:hypothetical protein